MDQIQPKKNLITKLITESISQWRYGASWQWRRSAPIHLY